MLNRLQKIQAGRIKNNLILLKITDNANYECEEPHLLQRKISDVKRRIL